MISTGILTAWAVSATTLLVASIFVVIRKNEEIRMLRHNLLEMKKHWERHWDTKHQRRETKGEQP